MILAKWTLWINFKHWRASIQKINKEQTRIFEYWHVTGKGGHSARRVDILVLQELFIYSSD